MPGFQAVAFGPIAPDETTFNRDGLVCPQVGTCIHSAVGTTTKFRLAHDIGKFHVELVINNGVNEHGLSEEKCE